MPHRLLIIEGAETEVFAYLSAEAGFRCHRVSWADACSEAVNGRECDLVVVVPPTDGAEVLQCLTRLELAKLTRPLLAALPVEGDPESHRSIVQAADDFVFLPIRDRELRHRIERLLGTVVPEPDAARDKLIEEMALTRLVGRAPVFLEAIRQVPRFARVDAPVLITGETGTGKELCARALHHLGKRAAFPFVAIDCGALPEQLFESELFGHVRGAFTDAHRDRRGLVAMADRGTLLLDEVDALSLATQAKLLRFLQERSYRSVGSDRVEHADVKIIAATNRDLAACVRDKTFRADLLYRLDVLHVHLPPLRDRADDIALLAGHLLRQHGAMIDHAPTSFSEPALRILRAHGWPGNVRELSNVVQRAVIACEGERILPADVALVEHPAPGAAGTAPLGPFRAARAAALACFERQYVEELLRKHGSNVTHAAREAEQERRAFGRLIKKLQIDRQAI